MLFEYQEVLALAQMEEAVANSNQRALVLAASIIGGIVLAYALIHLYKKYQKWRIVRALKNSSNSRRVNAHYNYLDTQGVSSISPEALVNV